MRFAAVAATTAVALMVALGATEVAGVPTGARSDGFRTQRSDSAVADVADSRFARVDNSTGENTTEGVAEAAESGAAPGGNATAPAPHQPNTTAPVPAAANTNTVEEATPVASDSPADEAPVEEPLVLLFDDEHRPGPDLPPSCKDHDVRSATSRRKSDCVGSCCFNASPRALERLACRSVTGLAPFALLWVGFCADHSG